MPQNNTATTPVSSEASAIKKVLTYPLKTIATASFRTDSPNTNAYKLTSTCKSWNIARMVRGSVGDINAPKYKVSKNVKLLLKYLGINFTQPYMIAPIKKADKVQPPDVLEASMNQNNEWRRPQLNLIKEYM
ncbi:hypothetical protein GQX74_009152 [Glossina fuscipes]|nr:hypothetical protein GQX74_009152 [Glossina fuscipes]